MKSTKVLMVCLGNICRSPMADAWLGYYIKKNGLDMSVDSAGTANYHTGSKPDHRMIAAGKNAGVDLTHLRARQFTVQDFEDFDIIFAMDLENQKNILKLARNEQDKQKVSLYLNELFPNENREVPDPYYGTTKDFEDVVTLLKNATEAFLSNIEK